MACVLLLSLGGSQLQAVRATTYRPATCAVVAARMKCVSGCDSDGEGNSFRRLKKAQTESVRRRRRTRCQLTVESNLTGAVEYDLKGSVKRTIEEPVACSHYGTECRYDVPRNCSGECYVAYKNEQVLEITTSSSDTIGLGFGVIVSGLGACAAIFGFLCCSCIPVVRAANAKSGNTRSRPHATKIGAVLPDDDGGRSLAPLAAFEKGLQQLAYCLMYFVGVVGVAGCIAGAYIGGVLFVICEVTGLDTRYSWAGFGICGVVVVFVLITWIALGVLKRKARQTVEEVGGDCSTFEELQHKVANHVIAKLESKEAETYKCRLLDAGVGADQIERVLKAPRESMLDEFLSVCSGIVLAKICCKLVEDALMDMFDQSKGNIVFTYLAFPSILVFVVYLLADFCAKFQVSHVAEGVAGSFMLLAVLFAVPGFLDKHKLSTACAFIGLCVSMVTVVVNWAVRGTSGLSVILWLLAINLNFSWLACCCLWFCYLSPLFQAVVAYLIESVRVEIFTMFGLSRDPKHLDEAEHEVEKAAGFLSGLARSCLLEAKMLSE